MTENHSEKSPEDIDRETMKRLDEKTHRISTESILEAERMMAEGIAMIRKAQAEASAAKNTAFIEKTREELQQLLESFETKE